MALSEDEARRILERVHKKRTYLIIPGGPNEGKDESGIPTISEKILLKGQKKHKPKRVPSQKSN